MNPPLKQKSDVDIFKKCSLYKLHSVERLAKLLRVSVQELEEITDDVSANYRQFDLEGRWIETPKQKLKAVQRWIHLILVKIPPPEYLNSAYKRKSAVTNALRHRGDQPMIKMDIRKFYPSADGRNIHKFFSEKLKCAPHIACILWKLCSFKTNYLEGGSHIPTGGVTSPILAYFAYWDMFQDLNSLAEENQVICSVLADDITISGPAANGALLVKAEQIIWNYGLRSHFKKRTIWSAEYPLKIVTGVHLTAKGPQVPHYQKKKIAVLKLQLDETTNPRQRAKLYQQLCGLLSSAGQIEDRFKRGAAVKMNEWKNDRLAWEEHLIMSGSRPRSKKVCD